MILCTMKTNNNPFKTTGQTCFKCGSEAKYYSDHKWHCGFQLNGHGYCKKEAKNDNDR